VRRLPAWPETARIVTIYTGIAGIDPRSVLGLIRREMGAAATPVTAQAVPPPRKPASQRFAELKRSAGGGAARLSTRLAQSAVWDAVSDYAERVGELIGRFPIDGRRTGLLALLLLVLAVSFGYGNSLQASLATLHPPIARLMRGAQDYLLLRSAPVRDGLRWIQVDDPRTRRSDRLGNGKAGGSR
jgi:hypothetical protein